jgi:two-component system, NtrC family, sensor kinase
MSTQQIFRSTLRSRILMFTGAVLLAVLLIISQVLLYQWREVIIAKQCEASMAVARTFSATVIDALIREDQSAGPRESILQTSLEDFRRSVGNVKYVVITDPAGQPRAANPASSAAMLKHISNLAPHAQNIRIINDSSFSWVLEVRLPLAVGGKSWGVAVIGFDAAPIRDEIRAFFFLLFFTTIIVCGATLVVLHFLATRLTKSLRRLTQEIDSVELGRGSTLTQPREGDDIAFLFDRFDVMKRRIDASRMEIEQAQRQVYQAEKLASIGRLASGVAHQVNNPLNGIRTCLYAIRQEPDNAAQTREYVDLIDEGITSIENVVQKLLGFARQQPSGESRIDIAESTRKVAGVFDIRLKEKHINIELDLPERLPLVAIEYHLFQEVVMNLLLNSYDAVDDGGHIVIAAAQDSPGTVRLSIRDDGMGIPPDILPRIFDPFFTTKGIGTGTGLGLSVCQSIVESHGGRITAHAGGGRGAEFVVVLPTGEEHEDSDH